MDAIDLESAAQRAEESSLNNIGIKSLTTMCGELKELRKRIENGNKLLKELGEKERELSQGKIPQLMLEVGLKKYTLAEGGDVSIKDDYAVSIKDDNREAIMGFIKKEDSEEIIKNQVVVTFTKGEDDAAEGLFDELIKKGLDAIKISNVHPMTFKAFLRECEGNGTTIPFEEMGIYKYQKTIIKE